MFEPIVKKQYVKVKSSVIKKAVNITLRVDISHEGTSENWLDGIKLYYLVCDRFGVDCSYKHLDHTPRRAFKARKEANIAMRTSSRFRQLYEEVLEQLQQVNTFHI